MGRCERTRDAGRRSSGGPPYQTRRIRVDRGRVPPPAAEGRRARTRAAAPGRTSPRAGTGRIPPRVGQQLPLGGLRAGEGLLGAVVDARDAEREELKRDAGDHLVVGVLAWRVAGKAQLLAEDVIVVVEDRDVAVAEVAVRARSRRRRRSNPRSTTAGCSRPLSDAVEGQPHPADVECRVEVALEHVEVAVLRVVAAGDLADEKEVRPCPGWRRIP